MPNVPTEIKAELNHLKSSTVQRAYIELDRVDIRRTQFASEARQSIAHHTEPLPRPPGGLTNRIKNNPFNFEGNLEGELGTVGIPGITLAAGLYGGLHLLAWSGPFASKTEGIMWRVSGVAIASTGVYIMVWALLVMAEDKLETKLDDPRHASRKLWATCKRFVLKVGFKMTKGGSKGLFYGGGLLCLLYVFARAFIVIECFIQLFHLPDAVYQEPDWSQYFPHII